MAKLYRGLNSHQPSFSSDPGMDSKIRKSTKTKNENPLLLMGLELHSRANFTGRACACLQKLLWGGKWERGDTDVKM